MKMASTKDIISLLPSFSGKKSDYVAFRNNCDRALSICTAEQKEFVNIVIETKIGNAANNISDCKTWEEYKAELDLLYIERRSSDQVVLEVQDLKQRSNESLQSYKQRAQEIKKNVLTYVNPKIRDYIAESVTEKFVNGLRRDLRLVVRTKFPKTIGEAFKVAEEEEMLLNSLAIVDHRINLVQNQNCHYCDIPGHFQRDCRKKQRNMKFNSRRCRGQPDFEQGEQQQQYEQQWNSQYNGDYAHQQPREKEANGAYFNDYYSEGTGNRDHEIQRTKSIVLNQWNSGQKINSFGFKTEPVRSRICKVDFAEGEMDCGSDCIPDRVVDTNRGVLDISGDEESEGIYLGHIQKQEKPLAIRPERDKVVQDGNSKVAESQEITSPAIISYNFGHNNAVFEERIRMLEENLRDKELLTKQRILEEQKTYKELLVEQQRKFMELLVEEQNRHRKLLLEEQKKHKEVIVEQQRKYKDQLLEERNNHKELLMTEQKNYKEQLDRLEHESKRAVQENKQILHKEFDQLAVTTRKLVAEKEVGADSVDDVEQIRMQKYAAESNNVPEIIKLAKSSRPGESEANEGTQALVLRRGEADIYLRNESSPNEDLYEKSQLRLKPVMEYKKHKKKKRPRGRPLYQFVELLNKQLYVEQPLDNVRDYHYFGYHRLWLHLPDQVQKAETGGTTQRHCR